jgi:hypothetical protein
MGDEPLGVGPDVQAGGVVSAPIEPPAKCSRGLTVEPTSTTRSVHFSSADQTWNTPRWFIDRVVRALGPIGLDPCSNEWSVVGAAREVRFDRGEDGLAVPWGEHGLVFVNPPFGRAIGAFMQRCATADECVALVPARVDARWWHDAYAASSACVLWRGRLAFRVRGTGRGNAPFPSSVFYFGARSRAFLGEFARDGIVAKGGGA